MENGETRGGWRFRLGVIVFGVSFLSPALIPVVAATALSTELKATLSGFLALGIPEIGVLIAVAIMGKPGSDEMKRRIFGFLKQYGPPKEVSLARYRIGLEPPRDCRMLQLLRRRSHYEQDNEQVFT